MNIALYQPDIPQNAGTIIRLGACLRTPVHLIEPMGFALTDRTLKRAGLDYLERAVIVRHVSFAAFLSDRSEGRLVLATTKATQSYTAFGFDATDTVLLGRESAGVPDSVHDVIDAAIKIPIHPESRSLNVAVATAMILGEALRQTSGFP